MSTIPANTEVIEKKVDLEAALSRMRRPLDLTQVNVEVYGVYSLPDQWRQKIAENDPSEQSYQYELEVCGMTLRQAKVFARELTEEEKAEAAAAANAKGGKQPPAPAKPDPKKPGAGPEEPSKEEVERLEKEKREREEKERKLREEWDSFDEDTKFFRTAEDIFKQPCIKFHNTHAQKKIETLQAQLATLAQDGEEAKEVQGQIADLQAKIYTGQIATEKQGFELVEFEEWVQKDRGCWVRFMKLIPLEEGAAVDPKAAAAKGAPTKGAPAKGAGGPSEMKPYYARAWIDFEDLLKPGALETKQRVYLETCQPMIKKAGDDGIERWMASEEPLDPLFEQARAYISLKLTLTEPVTPQQVPPHQPGEPLPQDVVPVKQFIRWPFSKEPTDDFRKQVTLAVESLAKEYYNLFKDDLHAEQRDRTKSESDRVGTFEERKKEFLYEINTSGKYHIMKEKMKKTIVRIVKEYFGKKGEESGIKGIYKDERDHFYSQLYAYLVAQMRATVKEIVARKKNELHENITVPKEQCAVERDRVIAQVQTSAGDANENITERYKRLAWENEYLYGNTMEAEQFMLKYIASQEGDANAILEMGRFYLRQGKQDKADQYLRDAYSFNIRNQRLAFMYAGYLLQSSRTKEAIVILNRLTTEQYEPVNVGLLLSMAYESDQDPLLAAKYKSVAFLHKIRNLENSPVTPSGQARDHGKPQAIPPKPSPVSGEGEATIKVESAPAFGNHRLTHDQEDELYLSLAQSLQEECIWVLARNVIGFIRNSERQDVQQALGRILIEKRNYVDALRPLQWIISQDEGNVATIANIGHCHYMQGQYQQAEQCYIQAIRIASFSGRQLNDDLVLLRLGSLYNLQKQYGEAAVIFEECYLKYPNNSFSLLNYGITIIYAKNPDYNQALKYLARANQLNPYNADIWGYLLFASLKTNQIIQAFQAQKEALKLKLSNVDLLQQIAQTWITLKKHAEAKDALEATFKARANAKQAKKIEEFLKAVEGIQSPEELKIKAKEILVKSNAVKEDDWVLQRYLETNAFLLAQK